VSRPTRASESGRAYLDLQNRARSERRGTQELLTLYVVERWLARLSTSPHVEKFVVKGGMLLAAYDARRPTATPAPTWVAVPSLRPGLEPVQVLGYPIETVLAEKVATAIALGPANTRVRDYADIYALTGKHAITHRIARRALLATTAYRGTPVQRLSDALGNFAELRRQTFDAYRKSLGDVGLQLPADLKELVSAVTAFADPLAAEAGHAIWQPNERQWSQLQT
jgi:hypothetical protein